VHFFTPFLMVQKPPDTFAAHFEALPSLGQNEAPTVGRELNPVKRSTPFLALAHLSIFGSTQLEPDCDQPALHVHVEPDSVEFKGQE
jgi:hypothetical protein